LLLIAARAWGAPSSAEIVSVEGRGEYREAHQSSWRPAAVRQSLFPGNFVRTLDLSKMAILFADRTQVQLAQNSTLQIKEVAGAGGERTILNLNRGKSWTQSKTTPRALIMETPSALAAIRGTDWEMIVDDDGRATLSVFSGEVDLYNDHGNVLVSANEQAQAERGRAPVKLTLQISRSRIQWVSSFGIDPARLRGEALADAYERLRRAPTRNADEELLLADIEIYRGEPGTAEFVLERGAARFPGDERFDVARARVAALQDDSGRALAHVRRALERRDDSVEALVLLGDIERREGRPREALAAYARAMAAAPRDARARHGAGVVESERENVRRARAHLEAAISLDPSFADAHAELGTLEGFAGRIPRGREALRRALALQPDNYVALTGLGVLEMRAGNVEAALDALLRATLIEPRYARAHVYLAAAYYALEREGPALDELARAAELDPKDPLSHVLASIVHLDYLEPGRAVAEARLAQVRIPFLKSLNQVADNQKGVANVGAPLAFMGLEAWARSAAHDSYLPFWGASHLFLADRYPGGFNRRAELMQGFITNPIVFGASNRFQSLVPRPGHHATVSVRHAWSDDFRATEPVATLNGYDASRFPVAYFAEAIETRLSPRNADLRLEGPTYTFAVGARPTDELGLFAYFNRVSLDADLGRRDVTGEFANVTGSAWRVDAGARRAFGAHSSLWLKGGASRESSAVDQVTSIFIGEQPLLALLRFEMRPRAEDAALRHTVSVADRFEITWGAEGARVRSPRRLERDAALHFPGFPAAKETLVQTDVDRSRTLHAYARIGPHALQAEAGLAHTRYRIERDIGLTLATGPRRLDETIERRGTDPLLGLTWRPDERLRVRAACREWLRPASLDTFAPVAVAGMPFEDQLVLAGGTLRQCRAQLEWLPGARTFFSALAERSRVRNVVSPLDGVLNARTEITNLDRLRNRALAPPPKPDLLEDAPVFGQGTVRRAHLAFERVLGDRLGLRAHYIHTDSENTAPALAGLPLPYLARHQANLGLTWAPGWRSYVTAVAVHRSRRFADEANAQPLPAGWDGQLSVFKESFDKRWSVELFAANLLKKEVSDLFGVVLAYRF
jgi:tetratricopeptide (TPR) repeat protein